MSLSRIIDHKIIIPNFCGICPKCRSRMHHIHDLKCPDCNNRDIVYCFKCNAHYRLDFSCNDGLEIGNHDDDKRRRYNR